jgi:voltage-gated potassium channel
MTFSAMVHRGYEGKVLFLRQERDPVKTLLIRGSFIMLVFVVIVLIFWYHRGDLQDSSDGDVSFLDVIYFTFITITTVGYGDIVPVTETARIIDAIIVTPLRIIIWLTFLGTAFEFIIPKYLEGYRLKSLQKRMSDHFIVVGYGSTGKAVAEELVHMADAKENIIVIDHEAERTEEAADLGFIAIRGDATRESTLHRAVIDKAKHIIIATGKDDTNVLVVLTARDMNPDISIVARANLEENTKLLRRSGAHVIIAPLVTGGKLMAASTIWRTAANVLEDILTSKHGLRVSERKVHKDEIGKTPKSLPKIVVIAVKRGKKVLDPPELDRIKLRSNDLLVSIEAIDEESFDKDDAIRETGPEPEVVVRSGQDDQIEGE